MSRTRTKREPYIPLYTKSDQLLIGGPVVNRGSATFGLIYAKDNSFTDEPIRNEVVYFKDCLHIRSGSVLCPGDRIITAVPPQGGYSGCWSSNLPMHYRLTIPQFAGGIVYPTLANIDPDLPTRALRKMMPSVNEGLSLVNFILELKDLRRMFHVWNKKHSKTKNVSGGYLNYMFGWVPMLSDLKDIWKALTTFKQKLAWLRSNQGKVLKRQYRRMLPGYNNTTVRSSNGLMYQVCWGCGYNPSQYVMHETRTQWIQKPTYCATMIYRYTLPKADLADQELEAFMDILGLGKLDPSIIWNAIPLTFVIDWVVNVGAWLRNLRPEDLGMKTEIIEFCHSVKYNIISESYVNPYNGNTNNNPTWFLTGQSYFTRYERKRANPSLWKLTTSDLSLREISLAGALVLANQKNKRRRPSQMTTTGQVTDSAP